MENEVLQAMARNKAFAQHNLDRLRVGETKICIDSSREVTYKTKAKDSNNCKPFKPLSEMTTKMLADAVNHSRMKKHIEEEVKSEHSQKDTKQDWQMSSSEDLYSDAGGDAASYSLPQIDPDKLQISATVNKDNENIK